jgi:hypothetical protein
MGPHQTKELLHSKGNSLKRQIQETAYRMGEKSLPATHPIRTNIQNLQGTQKTQPQRINKEWAHELNREFSKEEYKWPVNT